MTIVRMRVPSSSPYAESIGFSAAARTGDLIATAGLTALNADGEVVGGDDAHAQAIAALRKLEATLAEAGATLADVLQTRMYITRAEDWEHVGRAHGEVLGHVRPAATMVVTQLLDPRMRVEIEALAVVSR